MLLQQTTLKEIFIILLFNPGAECQIIRVPISFIILYLNKTGRAIMHKVTSQGLPLDQMEYDTSPGGLDVTVFGGNFHFVL